MKVFIRERRFEGSMVGNQGLGADKDLEIGSRPITLLGVY